MSLAVRVPLQEKVFLAERQRDGDFHILDDSRRFVRLFLVK